MYTFIVIYSVYLLFGFAGVGIARVANVLYPNDQLAWWVFTITLCILFGIAHTDYINMRIHHYVATTVQQEATDGGVE